MTLSLIILELAREKGHPTGSGRHGYEITAPLDENGHLDHAEWKRVRSRCVVRRFWEGEPDQVGELVYNRNGKWALSYDPTTEDDDEAIFRLDTHVFLPGEYISISDPQQHQHTFRVAAILAA